MKYSRRERCCSRRYYVHVRMHGCVPRCRCSRGKLENLLTCKVRFCAGNTATQNSIKCTFVTFSPSLFPSLFSMHVVAHARLFVGCAIKLLSRLWFSFFLSRSSSLFPFAIRATLPRRLFLSCEVFSFKLSAGRKK